MLDTNKFKTIRQASTYFHVAENTLRKWHKDGDLAGYKVGNRFYVNVEALAKRLGN